MRVLVIGGTGTVGRSVVSGLVDRGVEVRVQTRDPDAARGPEAARYTYGDLEDPTTLPPLFEDVDRAFLLTPLHPREAEMGRAAVAAASESGLQHLVFLSVHRVEEGAHIPHFRSKIEIEEAIARAGIPHTVVHPNNFYQNDVWLRDTIVQHGVYPQPLGPVGCSRCDTRDIAEMVVHALTADHPAGGGYPVVGPDVLTGADCATTWSRHLGREVHYTGDDLDGWAEQAASMLPGWLVEDLRVMYQHFQTRGLAASESDFERQNALLGHPPRSYDAFVSEQAGQSSSR